MTEWVLRGTLRRSELIGVHPDKKPGKYRALVHVQIVMEDDGTLRIDIDRPEQWSFVYQPGNAPVVSGPMSALGALVLSSGFLDRMDRQSAGSGSGTRPKALRPLDGPLVEENPTPLLECPSVPLLVSESREADPERRAAAAAAAIALVNEYYRTLKKDSNCDVEADDYDYAKCNATYSKKCDADLVESVLNAGYRYDQLKGMQTGNPEYAYGSCKKLADEVIECVSRTACFARMGGVDFTAYVENDVMVLTCGSDLVLAPSP